MKPFKHIFTASILVLFLSFSIQAYVIEQGDKVFLVDRTGEHWDVTQARSLGFKPRYFQYGIGKNAFTPLDDSHVKTESTGHDARFRVIGIENESETHAYSVPRLRYHEIANTHLGDIPIAAGY